MSFEGKVVLITGASSGIGADAARHLAKLGAQVSIVGRNKERLSQVADEIEESGAIAPLAIAEDVTKNAQQIVDETIEHFGQLNVLVNIAGIAVMDDTYTLKTAELNRIFDTNVTSVITMTQLCVPHLEKTKGNIVNVSSICGSKSIPNFTSFCMSKAALDSFTKSAALDLSSKGIRVNSVNPAMIRTSILETMDYTAEQAKHLYDEEGKRYLIGRVGEVADTSAAIAFLADDNTASFLTGVLLPVDGGISTGLLHKY
ncbi:uncharacterized oxidoreductase TM_0325-like [Sitodiplosis mosellana]|uniref:uncharacterized oxidoreductase TM_0325-like n=1 Tax=Sitodiplosis mosellana TaxID=263140 RepID=UPI002445224B|nr:uncharacterized oxidoreductase TM_0325-like [Sitodiplosis mosellana]